MKLNFAGCEINFRRVRNFASCEISHCNSALSHCALFCLICHSLHCSLFCLFMLYIIIIIIIIILYIYIYVCTYILKKILSHKKNCFFSYFILLFKKKKIRSVRNFAVCEISQPANFRSLRIFVGCEFSQPATVFHPHFVFFISFSSGLRFRCF